MDATDLFPRGFHPMADISLPDDITRSAPTVSRSRVGPKAVTYYFTDFGLSTMFAPDETNRLVTGIHGLDRDVPELSDDIPYDPFKTDIFILGNTIRRTFIEVSTTLVVTNYKLN